jgi:hypothetical protein
LSKEFKGLFGEERGAGMMRFEFLEGQKALLKEGMIFFKSVGGEAWILFKKERGEKEGSECEKGIDPEGGEDAPEFA